MEENTVPSWEVTPTPKQKQPMLRNIVLLFVLFLALSVGIYVVNQQRSIADTRSSASESFTASGTTICGSRCIATQITWDNTKYTCSKQDSKGRLVLRARACPDDTACSCITVAKTPTPTKTPIERCNKVCVTDATCGEGMTCVSVNGKKVCRDSRCIDISDCMCNKIVACNTSCTLGQEGQCGIGKICAEIDGKGKCRNSQCFLSANCACYGNASPTPMPTMRNMCNAACAQDEDCGAGKICTKLANGEKRCRNASCYASEDCLCYTVGGSPTLMPTDIPLVDLATPTPFERVVYRPNYVNNDTPTPFPTNASMLVSEPQGVNPTVSPLVAPLSTVTINPFYDAFRQTKESIVVSGTTEPNGELSINILPDMITGTVLADKTGFWTYIPLQKLTKGEKQMIVILRSLSGNQITKTEKFTVTGAFPFIPIVLGGVGIALVLGIGIFVGKKISRKTPEA